MGLSEAAADAARLSASSQVLETPQTPHPRGFGPRFWSVIGATFLGFVGVGAILPRLGPHVRLDLKASDFTVGLVIGIFSVVALLSRFLSGTAADRRGRKFTFLCGLCLSSLSGATYWLSGGIPMVFTARILQGMGEAFLYTAAATWVIELAPDDQRARALGFLSTGIWGGISVGPAIGQWLGSYQAAAALLFFSPMPAIWVLYKWVPDTGKTYHSNGRTYLAASRFALLPGLALGLLAVHYPAFTGFLVLHLTGNGNPGGQAFSAYAAMILSSRFLLSGLPDRFGPRITFYGGIACGAVGLMLISLKPSTPIAVAAAGLVGFGFSFPWPSLAAVLLGRVRESERASTLGVLTASVDLFVGLSAFLHGAVASHLGYPAVFWFSTACVFVGAIAGRRFLNAIPED